MHVHQVCDCWAACVLFFVQQRSRPELLWYGWLGADVGSRQSMKHLYGVQHVLCMHQLPICSCQRRPPADLHLLKCKLVPMQCSGHVEFMLACFCRGSCGN